MHRTFFLACSLFIIALASQSGTASAQEAPCFDSGGAQVQCPPPEELPTEVSSTQGPEQVPVSPATNPAYRAELPRTGQGLALTALAGTLLVLSGGFVLRLSRQPA